MTQKGVWDLQDVRDEYLQGNWSYTDTDVLPGPYSLWAFGYSNQGQLGINDLVQRSSPIQVPGTQWSIIDGGSNTSVAIKSDNTFWAWGTNGDGHLGQNNLTDYSSPIQLPGTDWKNAVFGQTSCFAVKTDNTLWAWGNNSNGHLGLNDASKYSSPVQIPGNQWAIITADHSTAAVFATKTDGTLWVWCSATGGKLGLNDTINRSSPTQIPGTQWNTTSDDKMSSGTQNTGFVTKTDGTLWAWGQASGGRLGLNDAISRSSPYQLPGTQWNTVSAGTVVLSTKTDGTLWSWGYNPQGLAGTNDLVEYSSPRQLPGTQWVNAKANNYFSTALKTDGTLWAWGGSSIPFPSPWNNPNVNYSSPIQLPGTDWAALNKTLGHNHGFFLKTP